MARASSAGGGAHARGAGERDGRGEAAAAGAGAVAEWASGAGEQRPYGMDLAGLVAWARELAGDVEESGEAVDARGRAPRLRERV